MLALALSACSSEKSGRAPAPKPAAAPTAPVAPEKNVTPPEQEVAETHVLQITALNFLRGGLEQCEVKNKIFSFTQLDRSVKTTVCKNSMVEVFVVSESGVVQFHAVDRTNNRELQTSSSAFDQSYELGKDRPMLRYSAENPYGFTYVMAEEVTGVDPEVLAQWNELNGKLASLRAQVLTAQQKGRKVPKSVLAEMKSVQAKLAKLAKKMEKSRGN